MLYRVKVEMAYDYNIVCIINGKIFLLKNKELEINIEHITNINK